MTVQDAWDIVAAVNADELAAQGIAVAVFKKDLLADARSGGVEIHRDVFAVEGQTAQSDTLDRFFLRDLDGGRIGDHLFRIAQGLFRIPELDAPDLGGVFHRDKSGVRVGDLEHAAHRLTFVGMTCPASGGAMRSDQGGILAENDPAGDMVRFLARLHIQSGTAARGALCGCGEAGRGGGDCLGGVRRMAFPL